MRRLGDWLISYDGYTVCETIIMIYEYYTQSMRLKQKWIVL